MSQCLNYKISGEANHPKLVLLHGLMGSAANWQKVVRAMSKTFQVLTFDQRGHGRSFQPSSGYAPKNYAEDLIKLLDDLNWQKIHLVGHSMGGRNALVFADLYAQRVDSLVIEDIGPESGPNSSEKILGWIESTPTPFSSRQEAKEFFNGPFLQELGEEKNPKMLADYFYSNIKETDEGGADWRFSRKGIIESIRWGREQSYWREWEGLRCPTLVIRGEHSKELPQKLMEEMARRQLLADTKVVAGSGHWVHFEKFEEFVETLQQFFKDHLNL